MKRLVAAVALCGLASLARADWPLFRHDPQLSGLSPLKGRITEPALCGEHFVGAYEGYVGVDPQPGRQSEVRTAALPAEPADLRGRFGLEPPLYDLRGDGTLTPMPQDTGRQIGKILADVPGLQSVEFDNAFGYRGGECGHLFAYDQEPRREVWQTPVEDDMFMPLVLLLDADGDGDLEAVVATHYRVMVFDAASGRKDAELRFHRFRNYGFFGAEDLDHDGLPEYVIITDFCSHMDVLDYDKGELKLLWRRDIDPDLSSREKVVRVGPDPIVDIDGDGRYELVFNLYNGAGDEQWHVVAYDALDGTLKHDLPRRFLQGIVHLQGEGPLLCTVGTEGIPLPQWGTLSVRRLSADGPQELWSTQRARWETWELPSLPQTRNTGATLGRRTCLVDEERGVLYLSRPGDGDLCVVSAVRWNGAKPQELWRVTGPGLQAAASADIDGDGAVEALLRLRAPSAEVPLLAAGASVEPAAMRSIGARPTSPIAVDLDADGRPEIVVNDDAGGIVALKPRRAADTWTFDQLWRAPGRAIANSEAQRYGLQSADLDGDGSPEVLVGGSNDAGQAQLRALNARGQVKWSRTFAAIDGSDPVWNQGCLTFWSILNAGGSPGVYVSVRRNLMHSDESYVLRGADGEVIWHQSKIQCPHALRAVGGQMVACRDTNGDGWEEVILTYPDVVMILDGRDGHGLMTHPTTGDDMPGWTAYAVPVVLDCDADGKPEIYWTASTYTTAAFDLSGKVLWHSEYKDSWGLQGCWAMPAFADFNSDGRVELIGAGYTDGLRLCDAATGLLLSRIDHPAPTGPAATCDIDGDGLPEAILPTAQGLSCVGMRDGVARVLWTVPLPAAPSAPIVADLDADGNAELVVVCADGFLRVVGGR